MKNKTFTYLLKLNKESEDIFTMFSKKLNWNKKETILKSLYIFHEMLSELEAGKKLVIQVRDEKSEDVINSIKKNLANYKVPKKVIFANELPRNAMGKVQKNLLRRQFTNLYHEILSS